MKFVHLDVHTDFSLIDSLVRVGDLISESSNMGSMAVGICDLANLYGAIRFYTKCMSAGIKPVLGTEIQVSHNNMKGPLKLFCMNEIGYNNIIKLISVGHQKYKTEDTALPIIPLSDVLGHSSGVICLSGGENGFIGRYLLDDKSREAKALSRKLHKSFGGEFYLELQRLGASEAEDGYIDAASSLAALNGIPVVATNAVRFLKHSDYETHEIRTCVSKKINLHKNREKNYSEYSPEQYLKSSDEMAELFSDIPSALENSVVIAKKCSLDIEFGASYLPIFETPDDISESDFLVKLSNEGLKDRVESGWIEFGDKESRDTYQERLNYELKVIIEMGFPGYFLIVADFIQWAKKNDVPVGPGRGSGAGSLVAYTLGITNIEPIRYDLIFERFLNPERVSMPDFDVDFCQDKRERVIHYVASKYGNDAVSQIITYGTAAAKGVIRDVARVVGHPYLFGDRISRMIPDEVGITISSALEMSPDFKLLFDTDPDVRDVVEHSLKMEGLARQVGKHAGGVLIAPTKLTDFTPIYCDSDGNNIVSQYDKDDVEKVGLVKFDFLGLRNLTIISDAVKKINRNLKPGDEKVEIDKIKLDEKEVFALLKRCETTAVFQLESRGMKELLKRLSPDDFEDIIALVALYRPGPLQSGMVDTFVNCKHEREEVVYPHKDLEPILKNTYGVILYQEQVMQAAQVLAGYSLGQADMLRRAMGKKKPKEMAEQRSVFIEGALKNEIDISVAESVFDDMEKFAAYGFNKSHSAAYALISYQTAWLKHYYPAEFMAAVLSSDMGNTDKVVRFMDESRRMGLIIRPPCVNESERKFTVGSRGEIIYGLEAIKGIGPSVLDEILIERKKSGQFGDLYDFCGRCLINKTGIESAIKSGMLDQIGPNRATLMESYPKAIKVGRQAKKTDDGFQGDLFGSLMEDTVVREYSNQDESSERVRLEGELKTLGLYITGHPMDGYGKEFISNGVKKISELQAVVLGSGKNMSISGQIVDMKSYFDKRGQTALILLDDNTSQMNIRLTSKVYSEYAYNLGVGSIVVLDGFARVNKKTEKVSFSARKILSANEYRNTKSKFIEIGFKGGGLGGEELHSAIKILQSAGIGPCPVYFKYSSIGIDQWIGMTEGAGVYVSAELIERLEKEIKGIEVEVVYPGDKRALSVQNVNSIIAKGEVKMEAPQHGGNPRLEVAELLNQARTVMGV